MKEPFFLVLSFSQSFIPQTSLKILILKSLFLRPLSLRPLFLETSSPKPSFSRPLFLGISFQALLTLLNAISSSLALTFVAILPLVLTLPVLPQVTQSFL